MPTPHLRPFSRVRPPVRLVVWVWVAGLLSPGLAQTAVTSSPDQPTHLVRGQVVSALDGSPVPRALVTVNSRSALTDFQGRFEFKDFIGTSAFASVRKPGFSATSDTSTANAQRLVNLDAPVLLKLYPDVLVSGTLTSREGAPLSHIQIRLLRSQYDGVMLRWIPAGFSQTDARGEYRISTPAGRFRLVSSYARQSFETGEPVLPVAFPEASATDSSTLLELRSGEERRVDLQAKVGPVYRVALRMEPTSSQRMNPRVTVSTSAGDEFYAALSSDQHLELPTGTYSLRVQADSREESWSGVSRVTVTGEGTPTVILPLTLDAQLTVELLPGDLSTTVSNPSHSNGLQQLPNLQQFNLSLHNQLQEGGTQQSDLHLRQAENKISSFHVPPGRYRLTASGGLPWHIQSATVGATDLLLDDLVIGSGSAGGTLRILVSNQTGTVHARTNLPQGASAWMYLIPHGPSLAPILPIALSSDGTGASIATGSVPPGVYTALLLDAHLQEDPRKPAFLASFVSGPTEIEVQANADTSFSLDLAKRKEEER